MENKKLKSFKDLIVWQKSADLAVLIYKITEKFPRSELYGIVNQMRRAVISTSSNLAEGFKRTHKGEKLQFYNIVYGSISELESQIEISKKLNFLSENDYQDLILATIEVSKMINGLIKSLNSKSYILNSNNAGQVMLLTALILGGAILGASTIAGYLMTLKIRASSDITNSAKAIFAADTGIEWELYKCFQCNPDIVCDSTCADLDSQKPSMSNGSDYSSLVSYDASSAPQYIKSIGQSSGAYRAFIIQP